MIFFSSKDLSNENEFLEKSKKEVEEAIPDLECSFFCGKIVMTFSTQFGSRLTEERVTRLLEIIELNFAKIKKLR